MAELDQRDLLGWARARPIRIAFFVARGEWSQQALDGVFADCYGRWGGRFSLVAPCDAGYVEEGYWPWLEVFDPDIVYCYGQLADNELVKVHEKLNPSEVFFHRFPDKLPARLHSLKPDYRFAPLSSLSVLFRQARMPPRSLGIQGAKILSVWHTEVPSRFFLDNFGSYSHSLGSSSYPIDAGSVGSILHVVSQEVAENPRRFGVPADLPSVVSEMEAFAAFAGLKVGSMSLLSSLSSPRAEIRDWRWSKAFNLVVGDSFEDRLIFWNSRLLTPVWLDEDLCCFRVTLKQLEDGRFVDALVNMLNKRNRVNDGSGGATQVCIRSSSHTKEELDLVAEKLSAAKVWGGFLTSVVAENGRVDPSSDSLRECRGLVDAAWARKEWQEFSWRMPTAKVPKAEPKHLSDVPSGQAFALGAWSLDLSLEYDEERPRAAGLNQWKIPSRIRLADAFEVRRDELSSMGRIPGWNRRSRGGNLSTFSSREQSVSSIVVPSIETAVYWALCRSRNNEQVESLSRWPRAIFFRADDSNEAQHLKGVLGMASGFSEARNLLLHPFLRRVFSDLGGAPSLADHDVDIASNSITKQRKYRRAFDLNDSSDIDALSSLVVKAAQRMKQPRPTVSLQELEERWRDHRASYWEKEGGRPQVDPADDVDWEEIEQNSLYRCLTKLRSLRMMFQGYPWDCKVCQHKNWVDFQALSPELVCDVCRSKEALPIGVPWHFRPNEFLIRSLQQHSVLSVVWALSAIYQRSMHSFFFRGPCVLRNTSASVRPDHEIDLLVFSDGKAIMCEVKSAWRSVKRDDISDFVALAKRVRPDTAIFAVMEEGGGRFADLLTTAAHDLKSHDIGMEVLTTGQYQKSDSSSLPY